MKKELRLLFLMALTALINPELPLSATLITPVVNASKVEISGRVSGLGQSFSFGESRQATGSPGTGLNAEISDALWIPEPGTFAGGWGASSSATLHSSISGTHLEASAKVESRGGGGRSELGNYGYGQAGASAVFDLYFMLDEAARFDLVGSVPGRISRGERSFNLSLLGAAQPIVDLPEWNMGNGEGFSGSLLPGTYRLTALVSNGAGQFNEYPPYVAFNFTMDFAPVAVPEGGATLLMLAMACAGMFGAKRATRKELQAR